jgi:hypothetical protein
MPRATASGEPGLSEAQRRARGLAGAGFLGLAVAALRWPRALSLPASLAAGWLGASHLVAAAIRYRGCPELGAIPTLVLGRRVETRCGPWELLEARLGLETPKEGEDRDGIACACR